ncbi:MAG: ChbG/HpnK family deacetylase, partial [Fibrobacter sp.]|nr:ChbG/HpnK family deacetylase [Fibrobacter sp.]
MIIINADDWGAEVGITDRILSCVDCKKVNSVSAMVFMKDSERAAKIALEKGIDTGLHLNFTLAFSSDVPRRMRHCHESVISFLTKHKFSQIIYNPFLKREFAYVYQKQVDEYCRLYQKNAVRIDGHNHMHLCANIIWEHLIPQGTFVRRNYSFIENEKSFFNRKYRAIVDSMVKKRYKCTDYFFNIQQIVNTFTGNGNVDTLKTILKNSLSEILAHPGQEKDYRIINSTMFDTIFSGVC